MSALFTSVKWWVAGCVHRSHVKLMFASRARLCRRCNFNVMGCLLCLGDIRSPDVCAIAPHSLAGGTVAGRLGCRVSLMETSLDVELNNRGGVVHIRLEFPKLKWCAPLATAFNCVCSLTSTCCSTTRCWPLRELGMTMSEPTKTSQIRGEQVDV